MTWHTEFTSTTEIETDMAKGQKHSNKEIRKPKADKPKKGAAQDNSVTATFSKSGKAPAKPAK